MSKISFVLLLAVLSLQPISAQISTKKLIKEHKKAIKSYRSWDEMNDKTFIGKGPMTMGDVTLDLLFTINDHNLRIETTVSGVTFYQINTDTLTWSYDPFEQQYEFELPEDTAEAESNFLTQQENQFMISLEAGFEAKEVSEVRLDSITVYKLNTQLNDEQRTFYFSPTSFYLLGHEIGDQSEFYFGHKEIDGWLWPTTFVSKNEGSYNVFRMNDIQINDEVDLSVYAMDENAKKHYVQFLNEQNESVATENSFETLFNQADTYRQEGQLEKALEYFDKAIALNPNHSGAFNLRGLVKSDLNNEYGAIADFERSLELEPQNAAPYSNRGLSKYYLQDYERAKADFEIAISMDSTQAVFYSNLGLVYMDLAEWQNMFSSFDQAISLAPEDRYYYYYRGLAKAELEDYKGAVADYDKAAEELDFANLFNYRGVSYSYLDDDERAAKDFKQAMDIAPENLQFQVNYANSLMGIGQYKESIEGFGQVLAADSTWTSANYYRGLVYFELEKYDSALMDFNIASDNDIENALYFDYKAYSKEKLGDLTGAIEDFSQSLKLQEDSNIYYRRGLVKIELKDKKNACLDFKSAADLDDENGKKAFAEHCKLE